MIELFSGSKTVSKTFEANGWQSFSIDNNPKLQPSLCFNLLDISLDMLPKNPDFIWASPDCRFFSRAGNSHTWQKTTPKYRQYNYIPITLGSANSFNLLTKTIEIIRSFPQAVFIIENPIGRIQHMPQMKSLGHYRYAVNYADFGFFYSKETYIFSNIWLPFSTKKVHSSLPSMQTISSRSHRSLVPVPLVQTIIDWLP